MNKLFSFESLIGLAALFVASCAAYYSINNTYLLT